MSPVREKHHAVVVVLVYVKSKDIVDTSVYKGLYKLVVSL